MESSLERVLAAPALSRSLLDRADKLTLEQERLLQDLRGPMSGRKYQEIRERLTAIADELSTLLPNAQRRQAC